MKKSVLKSVLAAIAVVMMSCTTTANAQTGNTKYIYGQNDTNTTVYTLNEDGKTLTRKLKYEYKHDENGQVIEKKAYRWDAYRELWKPAYLLTVTPGVYEIKLNYAEWNAKESTFNHNKQESIYREGNNANLLADTQNKKVMETLNETQTQNKNATSLWQTIGMYIGMMVGFLYPQIGLGLGMLFGNSFGKTGPDQDSCQHPTGPKSTTKSAIILILAFLILFMNHWYVPCKHAIAHLMN